MTGVSIKVVIASHVCYMKQLRWFLESLDYKRHIDRIIVVVAGVPEPDANDVAEKYSNGTYFELLKENVLTTSLNMDEYASFVALGDKLRECPQFAAGSFFMMLHDTCEAGRLFWRRLEDIEKEIGTTLFRHDPTTALFVSEKPAPMYVIDTDGSVKYACISSVSVEDGRLVAHSRDEAEASPVYVNKHFLLSRDVGSSMDVGAAAGDPRIVEAVLANMFMWYPLTVNYNFGVAHRAFLTYLVAPSFKTVYNEAKPYTKDEGIDIELNHKNPLSLLNLGKMRCRYVYHRKGLKCCCPVLSNWINEIDVYDNGTLRNVAYVPLLDLKKFTHIRGVLAQRTRKDMHD